MQQSKNLAEIRNQIRLNTHAEENDCVASLLESVAMPEQLRKQAEQRATQFVEQCRAQQDKHNILDSFLQEFSLSNHEGIALMCLAEALLRIPDKHVADELIEEKLSSGNWKKHYRKSDSGLVNMATIGLIMTGGFVKMDEKFTGNPVSWLPALGKRMGEPVVRQAIRQAMGIMGGQYVLGRSIDEAARIGRKENAEHIRFSFDMLGEGARTRKDAKKYFDAYMRAIESIGAMIDGGRADNVIDADGISVKLSALHPQYHFSHQHTVMAELLPMLKELAMAARKFNIGFSIDAEESERLDISLDLFESLAHDQDLADWEGLGLVIQAYQKRAPHVIKWVAQLARDSQRRFMVRLVKGAYWDREIKFAQEMGYQDYPVYTRKPNTDLSYQVCAGLLLNEPDVIFPQFATHNAHTVAIVWEMIEARKQDKQLPKFEFQRLHGMGDLLYGEVDDIEKDIDLPLRVYAPVGAHKDLLPYLVRRLLENGANSSFVNQFLDKDTPISEIVDDPVATVSGYSPYRHPQIPTPKNIYRATGLPSTDRDNSMGIDLDSPLAVEQLLESVQNTQIPNTVGPIVDGKAIINGETEDVISPADRKDVVAKCVNSSDENIEQALASATKAQDSWDKLGGGARGDILLRMADLIEQHGQQFMAIIGKEAGRTLPDTISEVREAADFCRYYGLQAISHFEHPEKLPGPTGELNEISLHGRGTFLCISPWNFPLAIFVGQIAAALAAGNSVIAKPAEQTPISAFKAIELFHQAGVPAQVLHLLTGEGSQIGPKLVNDLRITGVCFTGSTQVAKLINRQLSEREGPIVPLIAETGGQNCMIVDSSALPEQVVDDVINSAFNSAGQRCSALRVLCLQTEIADTVIEMLEGALDSKIMGEPLKLNTDVGPVIDDEAHQLLVEHIEKMQADDKANIIAQYDASRVPSTGSFFAPTIIEIENIDQLKAEVFGPVLHIVRYKSSDIDALLEQIKNTGFGLTMGVHSRREQFAHEIFEKSRVGNTYINRNVVGAVVGVQPFGGEGLSGTGPKAGGPHYLFRFATERTKTVNLVATGGDVSLLNLG